MARYIVPPKKPKAVVLLKCYSCGALYSPEGKGKKFFTSIDYEPCPECGYEHNSDGQKISLWRYNLIKWWRDTTSREDKKDD